MESAIRTNDFLFTTLARLTTHSPWDRVKR